MNKYFNYLFLLSFVSFGGHFARSTLPIYGIYFISDGFISPGGLGMLLAACSFPSMFLPLVIGYIIDRTREIQTTTLALLIMTILGQVLFIVASYVRSFWLAMFALILFGAGSSSVTAIQRILVTYYLKGKETFTAGFYVALGNVAKLLGKASVAPVTAFLHSYNQSMVMSVLMCMMSLVSYRVFTHFYDDDPFMRNIIHDLEHSPGMFYPSTDLEDPERETGLVPGEKSTTSSSVTEDFYSNPVHPTQTHTHDNSIGGQNNNIGSHEGTNGMSGRGSTTGGEIVTRGLTRSKSSFMSTQGNPLFNLPPLFYWFAGIHTLYILVFHLLINFIPHYAVLTWKQSVVNAGFISCIPSATIILLSPLVGYFVDKMEYSVLLCFLAALNAAAAYLLLLFTTVDPILIVCLISLSQAVIPSLTLGEIARSLPESSIGVAFGAIEVLDSLVNLGGNLIFGWLYNATGDYVLGMSCLMCLSVVGAVLLLVVTLRLVVFSCKEVLSEEEGIPMLGPGDGGSSGAGSGFSKKVSEKYGAVGPCDHMGVGGNGSYMGNKDIYSVSGGGINKSEKPIIYQ